VYLMVYFPSVHLLDTPPFVVGRGLRRSDWRQFKWTPSVINLPMQQFLKLQYLQYQHWVT
jgi:hypothetical protein